VRIGPGSTGQKIGEIPGGGVFQILDGPICADNTAWWMVDYQGLQGWTAEGSGNEYWLESTYVCLSNLIVGQPAEVMQGGDGRIFDQPNYNSARLGMMPELTTFDVIGGPVCHEPQVWVEVDYQGIQGWAVEVGLTFCDAYCGDGTYLNLRLPLLPLQTAVPAPGANPFTSQQIILLPPDTITTATAAQVTTLDTMGDGFVRGYAWSPDASHLAVAGTVSVNIYETLRLNAPPHVLTGFEGVINKVLYSPDGQLLVTGGRDGNLRLWDAETHESLSTLDHGEPVFEAVFSPDGSLLVARGGKDISLWEIDGLMTAQLRYRFASPTIEYQAPESWIFLAGKDELIDVGYGTVEVHNLVTGETRPLVPDVSVGRSIDAWALSPDGTDLVVIVEEMTGDSVMSYYYYESIWDIETGEQGILLSAMLLESDRENLPSLQLKFRPDGRGLLRSSTNQQELGGYIQDTVSLFDLQGVVDAEFSPDSSLLAFGLKAGDVRLYSGYRLIDVLYGIKGSVNNLSFSPDGRYLAAAGSDNTVRVWDVQTRQRLGTVSLAAFPSEFLLNTDQTSLITTQQQWDIASGQLGTAYSLPEGSRILRPGNDQRLILRSGENIVVYDTATAETVLEVPVSSDSYSFPTFSADGNWLAYVELNPLHPSLGLIKVVNLNDGTLVQTFQRQFERPRGLSLSPDGRLLILYDSGGTTSETPDGKFLIWEVASGNLLHTIVTGDQYISAANLAFSRDGTRIAWKFQGGVQIYELESQTLTITQEIEGLDWYPPAVTFNADGSLMALGDTVSDIHLIDTRTGESIATLKGHISPIKNLVFSRDGRRLYSTAEEGVLRIWGIP
jgi:WD40 repeat protein